MAENKNLNNNKTIPYQTKEELPKNTTEITTSLWNTSLEQGQSERDATHFRLREPLTLSFTCLSCGELFPSSVSLLQVHEHYAERIHLRHYSNCLLCQGKIYQYYNNRDRQVNYYHNCTKV